jgi:hypothetical protein
VTTRRKTRRTFAASAALVACAFSCVPNLSNDDSLIDSTRVLAVRADPAEAKPGAAVTFTALVAAPTGTIPSAPITWDFCTAPKPLTDDNIVSDACLDAPSLVPAGSGESTVATTPSNGCSLFGPDTPPGGFRPVSPDGTGGYYQPLRAELAGTDATFELARILCDLADAPSAAVIQFNESYHANLNPTLAPLTATIGGATASLDSVPAGSRVILTVSWPPASAETYAYFDPSSQAVVLRRESMQVAWYATAGSLDTESTGRAEGDLATQTTDGWSAPRSAGTAHLWVVLRDSRGGVAFASYDVNVVP